MATVFWDSEGILLTDYLEHGTTITGTYYADLIRKCQAALKEKRRGKLRRGVPCHHQLIRHHKHWLPPELHVSYCFATHRIWSIWPPVTYICCKTGKNHEKIEIYWLQWCYLDHKWLAGGPRSRILLQWHTGFGESLDQVHFCRRGLILKSDKISCWYSVVNCIRLRTFWTPLVIYLLRFLSDVRTTHYCIVW